MQPRTCSCFLTCTLQCVIYGRGNALIYGERGGGRRTVQFFCARTVLFFCAPCAVLYRVHHKSTHSVQKTGAHGGRLTGRTTMFL